MLWFSRRRKKDKKSSDIEVPEIDGYILPPFSLPELPEAVDRPHHDTTHHNSDSGHSHHSHSDGGGSRGGSHGGNAGGGDGGGGSSGC